MPRIKKVTSPVAIVGGFGLGNFGDDLLMLASASVAKRVYLPEEISVILHKGSGGYCSILEPSIQYVKRDWITRITADVLIYGGGTQFYQFERKTSLSGGIVRRALRFLGLYASGRVPLRRLWSSKGPQLDVSGCRFRAAASIGIGPFENNTAEEKARDKIAECHFVSVRDCVSKEYCDRWGIANALCHNDFGYARDLWCPEASGIAVSQTATGRIGVVVRDWSNSKEGANNIYAAIHLAEKLKARGFDVVFFLFAKRTDVACLKCLENKPFKVEAWDACRMSIVEYVAKLSQCDLLITARAHAAIVGAALGIPCICMEIEPKLAILAESLGLGAIGWKPPFDCSEGIAAVEKINGSLLFFRQEIRSIAEKNRKSALEGAGKLEEFLRSVREYQDPL